MFNEARLLDCVAYGSQFGHEFNTDIKALQSGQERRTIRWDIVRGRYAVLFQNLNPEDHDKVRHAHLASFGRAIPFRFKDWVDFQAVGESLGEASGVEQRVQLIKTYQFGILECIRPIQKPVTGTVALFEDGEPLAAVVDYTAGMATFTAAPGAQITWSGEFDVPVRFVSDRLDSDPVAGRRDGRFVLSSDVELMEILL